MVRYRNRQRWAPGSQQSITSEFAPTYDRRLHNLAVATLMVSVAVNPQDCTARVVDDLKSRLQSHPHIEISSLGSSIGALTSVTSPRQARRATRLVMDALLGVEHDLSQERAGLGLPPIQILPIP